LQKDRVSYESIARKKNCNSPYWIRIRVAPSNTRQEEAHMLMIIFRCGLVLALLGLPVAVAAPLRPGTSPEAGSAADTASRDTAPQLKFEVASIRIAKNPDPRAIWGGVQFLPGGRLVANQMPLAMLIAAAYNLPSWSPRISFAPGVNLPKDYYDIEAAGPIREFPSDISVQARDAKLRSMLQSLLADRFQLKVRIDPEDQPVYALVVGKDGPKLQRSKVSLGQCAADGSCHHIGGGQGRGIRGDSVSVADVAQFVQLWTDKPVVDETGLKDLYDIQTEGWLPMRSRQQNVDGSAPSGGDAGVTDDSRPTLFQIFAQLGLRVESRRAVVDMYIVESLGTLTDN
jgi:uncharacterized protein (TIGR03435 family)